MKRSIRNQHNLLISILIFLVFIQSLLLLVAINRSSDLAALQSNLQTIIIVFLFILFVYAVLIFNIIPNRITRSLNKVGKLINEVSHGNYQYEIQLDQYDSDTSIQMLLQEIKKLLNVLNRFDQSKADKIYEHHQRLLLLTNLLPQGALILQVSGEIKYCNDTLRRQYPMLVEDANINEILFKNELDRKVFGKIANALRYGNNLYDESTPDQDLHRKAVINGSIVRNRKGISTGGVFLISLNNNAE